MIKRSKRAAKENGIRWAMGGIPQKTRRKENQLLKCLKKRAKCGEIEEIPLSDIKTKGSSDE